MKNSKNTTELRFGFACSGHDFSGAYCSCCWNAGYFKILENVTVFPCLCITLPVPRVVVASYPCTGIPRVNIKRGSGTRCSLVTWAFHSQVRRGRDGTTRYIGTCRVYTYSRYPVRGSQIRPQVHHVVYTSYVYIIIIYIVCIYCGGWQRRSIIVLLLLRVYSMVRYCAYTRFVFHENIQKRIIIIIIVVIFFCSYEMSKRNAKCAFSPAFLETKTTI